MPISSPITLQQLGTAKKNVAWSLDHERFVILVKHIKMYIDPQTTTINNLVKSGKATWSTHGTCYMFMTDHFS